MNEDFYRLRCAHWVKIYDVTVSSYFVYKLNRARLEWRNRHCIFIKERTKPLYFIYRNNKKKKMISIAHVVRNSLDNLPPLKI